MSVKRESTINVVRSFENAVAPLNTLHAIILFFFFMSFSDEAIVKIRFGGVFIDIFKGNIKSIQEKLVTRNLVFKNPVRLKFAS